ncbi:hypothetical protein KEM54_003367 [Ascosphaera aggregata]|nr:hypothetical protein KEM54_003367 [Ascosphaera aggregata]
MTVNLPLSALSLTKRRYLVTVSHALSNKIDDAKAMGRSHSRSRSSVSTTSKGNSNYHTTADALPERIDARWLSSINHRIGKCLAYGATPSQTRRAGGIARQLAMHWRELVAGSQGYVTTPEMRSLFKHPVVWGEMVQTARTTWVQNLANRVDPTHRNAWMALLKSDGVGLILKSIKTDFKFPMTWPDRITVYSKLTVNPHPDYGDTDNVNENSPLSQKATASPYRAAPAARATATVATSSFTSDVLILSEKRQRPAAHISEEITVYDYTQARKVQGLPPFMLGHFQKVWDLQNEIRVIWRMKANDILRDVRNLELEVWDRDGAVEDLGYQQSSPRNTAA